MGRPRVPTALKLLRGNPGKRRIDDNEPKPNTTGIACPYWLDLAAKREWRRIVPELQRLGLLTMVDIADLAGYCQAWAEVRELRQLLKTEGRTMQTATGYLAPHPLVKQYENAWARVRAFASDFGFNPSARSRLKTEPPPAQDALDKFLADSG